MTANPRHGTSDPDSRAAFRAYVRANHPDVGGNAAEFAAGLQRFRAAPGPAGPGETTDRYDAPVVGVHRRGGIGGVLDRARRRRARRGRPPRVV